MGYKGEFMNKSKVDKNKRYVFNQDTDKANKVLVYVEYVKKMCGDDIDDNLIFGNWGLVDRLRLYQDLYNEVLKRQRSYIMGELNIYDNDSFDFDNAQKYAFSLINQMEQIVQQFVEIYKKGEN